MIQITSQKYGLAYICNTVTKQILSFFFLLVIPSFLLSATTNQNGLHIFCSWLAFFFHDFDGNISSEINLWSNLSYCNYFFIFKFWLQCLNIFMGRSILAPYPVGSGDCFHQSEVPELVTDHLFPSGSKVNA
jgi:hypothetical protein